MKTIFNSILFLALSIFLVACDGDAKTDNTETNTPPKDDQTVSAMTFRSVMADIDNYEGKEVTLELQLINTMTFNNKPVAEFTDGEKLELGESPFTILLGDDSDPIRALKEGDKVKIKGTVTFGDYGMTLLENPTVL